MSAKNSTLTFSCVELQCPKDRSELHQISPDFLACDRGHRFPIVEEIPVLLRDDVCHTMDLAGESLRAAWNYAENPASRTSTELFLASVGVGELERTRAKVLAQDPNRRIDPVVSVVIGATGGHAYEDSIGV